MANFFERFETSSQAERAEIAFNLQNLFNQFWIAEGEAFSALRSARGSDEYITAQKEYCYAMGKLGAIQAVFHELGIEFDGLYDLEDAQC